MEYRILLGSIESLPGLVQSYLEVGWSLVGGVAAGESGWLYQAITRDLR